MDYSLPCSSIHGILQARILEWFAISFSKGSSWPRDQSHVSYVFCIGRLVLYHLHNLGMNEWMNESCSVVSNPLQLHGLSMECSRQEYWSGLPLPSPRNLSDPWIEAGSPAWQADSLPSELQGGLRSKSCSQPALVNKVLLEHSYTHSFAYLWLLLCYSGRVDISIDSIWPVNIRKCQFTENFTENSNNHWYEWTCSICIELLMDISTCWDGGLYFYFLLICTF